PNLAYAPFALAKESGVQRCSDVSQRPCNKNMEALVVAFNNQLISSLGEDYANDGRNLGHIDAAKLSSLYSSSTSYKNEAACEFDVVAQPEKCNTQNL